MRKLKYVILFITIPIVLFVGYAIISMVLFNNRVNVSDEPERYSKFIKHHFNDFKHETTFIRNNFKSLPLSFYNDSLNNKLLYFQTQKNNVSIDNLIEINNKIEQRTAYESYKGGNLHKCMYRIIPNNELTSEVFIGIERFTENEVIISNDSINVIKIPNRFSLALNDKKQTLLIRDFTGISYQKPVQYLMIKDDGEILHFLFFQKNDLTNANDNNSTYWLK